MNSEIIGTLTPTERELLQRAVPALHVAGFENLPDLGVAFGLDDRGLLDVAAGEAGDFSFTLTAAGRELLARAVRT